MHIGIHYAHKCHQGQRSHISTSCILEIWSSLGLGFRGGLSNTNLYEVVIFDPDDILVHNETRWYSLTRIANEEVPQQSSF